eukprot:m.110376 g.110376  ORF g.110376 m.110376 type:complete len:338 (-) comp51800_c0_seq1:30-1043(-)
MMAEFCLVCLRSSPCPCAFQQTPGKELTRLLAPLVWGCTAEQLRRVALRSNEPASIAALERVCAQLQAELQRVLSDVSSPTPLRPPASDRLRSALPTFPPASHPSASICPLNDVQPAQSTVSSASTTHIPAAQGVRATPSKRRRTEDREVDDDTANCSSTRAPYPSLPWPLEEAARLENALALSVQLLLELRNPHLRISDDFRVRDLSSNCSRFSFKDWMHLQALASLVSLGISVEVATQVEHFLTNVPKYLLIYQDFQRCKSTSAGLKHFCTEQLKCLVFLRARLWQYYSPLLTDLRLLSAGLLASVLPSRCVVKMSCVAAIIKLYQTLAVLFVLE